MKLHTINGTRIVVTATTALVLFVSAVGTTMAQNPKSTDQDPVSTPQSVAVAAQRVGFPATAGQTYSFKPIPPGVQELFGSLCAGGRLLDKGKALLSKGDIKNAKVAFNGAFAFLPEDSDAFYGLAKCAAEEGDTNVEIDSYRKIVYGEVVEKLDHKNGHETLTISRENGFRSCGTEKIMEFAILLSENGQFDESLSVYQHGIEEFRRNRPQWTIVFPDFKSGHYSYAPNRLEAMANVVLNIIYYDYKNPTLYLDRAVKLAPSSAIVHYYLGRERTQAKDRRRDWQLALRHDDGSNAEIIKKALKTVPAIP